MNLEILKDKSFWQELWNKLFPDDTTYEYLGNGADSLTSLRMIIIGLFIGLALAAFGSVFNKRVLGDFVRALLREESLSPESAKTLAELGYTRNTCIRQSLRSGVTLRRVVRCREEEEYLREQEQMQKEYEEKRKENPQLPKFKPQPFRVKVDEHHFYIPEELKYMADVKFEKKGTNLLGAVLFVVVLIIATVILFAVLPSLLSMLDGWFGSIYDVFSYKDNVVT